MTDTFAGVADTFDPLVYLEQNIGTLGDAVARKSLADKLDEFSVRWDRNKEILTNLEAVAAHADAFKGVNSPGVEDAKTALLAIADFARDMSAAANRDHIKTLIAEFAELTTPAAAMVRELKRAYADLSANDFEPLSATGHVLSQIDTTSDLGERLKNLATKARNLAARPAAEFLRGVSTIRAEADKLKGEYQTVSNVQGAKPFLDALIQGRATLAHVNADVLTWLDTLPGARERFRITSG